jgi:hypothetical protein
MKANSGSVSSPNEVLLSLHERYDFRHVKRGQPTQWFCGRVEKILVAEAGVRYEIQFDDGEECTGARALSNSSLSHPADFYRCSHSYPSPSPKYYSDEHVETNGPPTNNNNQPLTKSQKKKKNQKIVAKSNSSTTVTKSKKRKL